MRFLTAEQIAFLRRQRVAYLATVDGAGHPHVLPVCFVYLRGALYTPVDEKPKRVAPSSLRRIQNIMVHPEVCVVADHYEEDWTRLAWLQVRGIAELVTDPDECRRACAALRERYPQYRAMDLESRPLIRIKPARTRRWAADAMMRRQAPA